MRLVIPIVLASSLAHADRGDRCEGDTCDVDPGITPWIWRYPCPETSDVVGVRSCQSFGQWSVDAIGPELVLEAGVGMRHIVAPTRAGVAARATDPTTSLDLATTTFRILGEEHGVHAGVELEVGDLLQRERTYGDLLQSGGVLGVDARLWRFAFGAEVMFGARHLRSHVDDAQPTDAAVTSAVIEARVDLGLWLTPWLTITGDVGAGVLERAEWVAALDLGFHVRSFGGR